jgi:hypothetical protein
MKPRVCVARQVPGNGLDERLDRLVFATDEQRMIALAVLSGLAPETYDAIMDAAEAGSGELAGAEEPEPRCARCHATIGIFLSHGLEWRHYRGDGVSIGQQEIFFPGHDPVPYAEPGAYEVAGAGPLRRDVGQGAHLPGLQSRTGHFANH